MASIWWRVRSKNRYGSGSFQLRKLRSRSGAVSAASRGLPHRAAQPEDRFAGRGDHALFAQEESQVAH